jgi:hypothetical protein
VGAGGAEDVGVVERDVGDHRDLGVGHVGRVPAAGHADLEDGDVDGDVGEPAEGGEGEDVEAARPDASQRLEGGDGGERLVSASSSIGRSLRRCAR